MKRAVFTAEDPWDADQDTESNPEQLVGVLRNSLCHEFDLLGWLWPDSTVTLSHVEPRSNSGAFIAGTVHHAGGASTAFEVHFSKGHSTHYGQLVELDGRKFGYPQFKVASFEEAGLLYENHVEQLARFYRSCVMTNAQHAPKTKTSVSPLLTRAPSIQWTLRKMAHGVTPLRCCKFLLAWAFLVFQHRR